MANLYWPPADKNLYFDATHMKGKSPQDVADLIQMLNKPGGFEDTLSYVSLPVLGYTTEGSYGANDRRQRDAVGQDGQMTGRNSAVAVFDKLAEVGVRNVLQLIVEEDPKSPHHTDAAIERAISGGDSFLPDDKRQQPGFAVETWYVPGFSSTPSSIYLDATASYDAPSRQTELTQSFQGTGKSST